MARQPLAREGAEAGSSVVEMGRTRSGSPGYADLDVADAFSEKSVRRDFVRKVYFILALQLTATTAIICTVIYLEPLNKWVQLNRWFTFALFPALFGLIITLACFEEPRRRLPLNFILLGLFLLRGGRGALGAGSHGLRQLRTVPVRPADQVGLHGGPGLPVGSGAGSPRLRDHRRHRPVPVAQDLVRVFWDPDLCSVPGSGHAAHAGRAPPLQPVPRGLRLRRPQPLPGHLHPLPADPGAHRTDALGRRPPGDRAWAVWAFNLCPRPLPAPPNPVAHPAPIASSGLSYPPAGTGGVSLK
ncbi:uncharacterized protein LOC114813758 isoform X1 [Ornithorhynchus anatinus]|uniref:uncharacterized protein LOC114813758 isoform X1 n=1 Tax=Ornithorhynchus anatinus TaxID=9258 RepID=UPI0019D4C870|nr:uncharacterized protein LOC114813758 isoform X1 [Ornithorhynchus anatinus]